MTMVSFRGRYYEVDLRMFADCATLISHVLKRAPGSMLEKLKKPGGAIISYCLTTDKMMPASFDPSSEPFLPDGDDGPLVITEFPPPAGARRLN